MDEFEYLEKSKNEIITIDNLNKNRLKPAFDDDCFIRYLFSDEGNENIVLDFTLFNDIKDFHSCYLLKEIKHNKILTDHCMLHYIELPKFNLNNNKEKLSSWIKFFKGENMSNLIKENNIFEEVEKRCQSFIDRDPLINAYRKKEWNEYFYKDMMNVEREEGKLEGIKNEKYLIAKNLKQMNIDKASISKATGLTIEEIEKL